MRKTDNYVHMIKADRTRMHMSRSHSQQKERDSVNMRVIVNLKERINYAFKVLMK